MTDWKKRAPSQPVLRSLNRLVVSIPKDRLTLSLQVTIEVARNLARQLDHMAPGGSGALAQAVPATARQFEELREVISAAAAERDDFLTYLFEGKEKHDN